MTHTEDSPRGLAFAIAAYLMWGGLPLYLKAISHVPALEVVSHRIIWSVPVASIILIILGRTRDIQTALKSPKLLAMGTLTAALISINWLTYVYAISTQRTLDAALGYYINPLFSVFLGFILLRERMRPLQWVAVCFAIGAVVVLAYELGSLPWISLTLTLSWGFYALFKRSLPIGPNQGFLLEVLVLSPIAIGFLMYLWINGTHSFANVSWSTTMLLMGSGVVTAVPLIVYANGAKLLRLSTIGMLQYIAPTFIFLTAVFIFDEPFGWEKKIAFPMIWVALAIYSASLIKTRRP
ncbi:MAG: EamA family transporter RarD [Rhodobacteraceae bacterium]|jgi:chloramphenicol-sensitive protein RarD|nr:EamA family transporter RarD [Paracoccaceae bacterium]